MLRRMTNDEKVTQVVARPIYEQYAVDVCEGKIATGELIKLACGRFLKDLERDDLDFRADEVDRCISFVGLMRHYMGGHNGEPFKMEPWQCFCLANVVGFYRKGSRRRKYTSSYIEIARKNGKSMWAAAIALYFLVADGEAGAEVLLAANSKDQAKIAFGMCAELARQINGLGGKKKGQLLNIFRADIKYTRTNSSLKVLASDDTKLDGFNASFGLVDEYHSAPNSRVRDVIESSMGMRERPHLMTITTAGFDRTLPCFALRTTCANILRGNIEDDTQFAAIYSLDEGDDWRDPSTWPKSNPNYGVTVKPEFLSEQVKKAMNTPSEEVGILTKNLNIWCDAAETWVSADLLNRLSRRVEWSEFDDATVMAGVDLAAVSDLTALAVLTERDGRIVSKLEYYLPSSSLDHGPNADLYRQWRREGWLNVTPGNVTDYDHVTKRLCEIAVRGDLRGVTYDAWNSTQWAIDATEKGLPLQQFSQSIGNFNKPTKELERLLLSGRVEMDYNPITLFCFANVCMKIDANGNEKPSKENRHKKIDGVIALIQALGLYLSEPRFGDDCVIN